MSDVTTAVGGLMKHLTLVTAPAAEPAAGPGRPPGLQRRVTNTVVRGADNRIAAVIERTEWVP